MELNSKNKKIGVVVVLILALWLGKTFKGQALMKQQLVEEKKVEQKKIVALERDIRNLEKEMEKKDSLEFVEKVAREDYKMVKPREIIYIDKNKKKNKKDFIVPGNK